MLFPLFRALDVGEKKYNVSDTDLATTRFERMDGGGVPLNDTNATPLFDREEVRGRADARATDALVSGASS